VDRAIIERRLAGVVDQHVHFAKLIIRSMRKALALLPPSHMTGIRHCPTAAITYGATDLLATFHLSARDHQISTCIGETERHGTAETPAAASDESHFSLQIDDVFVHVVLRVEKPG